MSGLVLSGFGKSRQAGQVYSGRVGMRQVMAGESSRHAFGQVRSRTGRPVMSCRAEFGRVKAGLSRSVSSRRATPSQVEVR